MLGHVNAGGAGTLGLGANLGFSAYNPEFGDDITTIGWPGSVIGYQPGLRVAYLGEARTHEGYLDTGMLHLSGGGDHGSLRFEARFDRVNEGNNMIESAGIFGFRVGFDLWMK